MFFFFSHSGPLQF